MTGDVRAMRGNKKRKDGRKFAGGRIRKADKGPRKGSKEGRGDKRGREGGGHWLYRRWHGAAVGEGGEDGRQTEEGEAGRTTVKTPVVSSARMSHSSNKTLCTVPLYVTDTHRNTLSGIFKTPGHIWIQIQMCH